MRDSLVTEMQRLYPQIYLACHVDHVRARSTEWRLSARDSSILAHLERKKGMSPRALADHLAVAPSTISAAIARLVELGYSRNSVTRTDRRQRELRLTELGGQAMAATSVLDEERVAKLVARLTTEERKAAARGLTLLARAARGTQKS